MKDIMKTKRSAIFIFIIIGLILSLFFININIVSAQYSRGYSGSWDLRMGSENIINGVVDVIEPFLQVILGGYDYTGLLLFERFLLFMIILSIVYFAIKRVPAFEDNKGVIWVISVVVPILSIRYMDFEWINTILIQYQVLGIAITGLLPFLIYMFFLHNVSENSTVRKIGWILFIVIYFGLWATNPEQNYGIVYFWVMAIALLFLLADGTIHRIYVNQELKESDNLRISQEIMVLEENLIKIEKAIDAGNPEAKKHGPKAIKDIKKRIKKLRKNKK